VGATENIILASVLGDSEVIIENPALEPEIVDLVEFLNRMGAKIFGAGTSSIKIKGVQTLKEVSYNVMPDRIEAGTLLVATAMTGGKIYLKRLIPNHLVPILHKLEEAGCKIEVKKDSVILIAPRKLKALEIKTMPYPGFPTDMQSIFSCMLTVAKGTSIITENIFENRFKIFSELKRMGVKANIEGKTLIIKGVRKLHGAEVQSTDLRGGAALVLAGLVAKGTTKVNNIEYILRGYENLDLKLTSLGANIARKGENLKL
jgi:UDP-N-acetylglucosamine 1-carboxyvinyltransferase